MGRSFLTAIKKLLYTFLKTKISEGFKKKKKLHKT